MNRIRVSSVFIAVLILSACAGPRKDTPSPFMPWGALLEDTARPSFAGVQDAPAKRIVADHTGDGQIVVLALSGGGSYGAFGAGVLSGWSESNTRPEADVVTGVSAGALLATYAFLGPEYDVRAKAVYATITNKRVYERRSFLSLPFSSSLVTQTPLRQMMESLMSDEVLDKVADERRKRGRRLLVASTDLDNGRVVIWDLTAIASSEREDRHARYIDALMASSAIPGFFKPVMVKAEPTSDQRNLQLHVDGSMSTSIFAPSMNDVPARIPLKVYAVVNSKLSEEKANEPVRIDAIKITAESLLQVMRSVLQRSVYELFMATTIVGGEFNLIGIPDDYDPKIPQYKFDPATSTDMFELGLDLSRQRKWAKEPPRFDSLAAQLPLKTLLPRLRSSDRVGAP